MKIRTSKEYKKGQLVQPVKGKGSKKKWVVVNVRKLVPFLGEQKGYLVELEEFKNEQ